MKDEHIGLPPMETVAELLERWDEEHRSHELWLEAQAKKSGM